MELMHAIAQSKGINFFSFLQPMLLSKKESSLTLRDKSWINVEYICRHKRGIDAQKNFRKLMTERKVADTHDYMYDLSAIFDTEDVYMDFCHVYEEGNCIIAEEIWKIIKKCVVSRMERLEKNNSMEGYAIGDVAGKERCFGVFSSAYDVPTFGINSWQTLEWYEFNKEVMIPRVQKRLERMKQTGVSLVNADAYLFPVMPLIRSKISEGKKIKIVDIGGGVGENYIRLESFFGSEYLEYHIVELGENCKNGRELHLPGNIYFHENDDAGSKYLTEEAVSLLKEADICLLVGVMQYFSQYVDLVKEIADTGIEYIYVARTLISNITNTFYTRQYIALNGGRYNNLILGDSVMAIINHQELNVKMYNLGYDICFDLFESDESEYLHNLPSPHNEAEYRNILYQSKKLKNL